MNNQALHAQVVRLETELRLLRAATEEYKAATTQTIEGLACAVDAMNARLDLVGEQP